jgi:hypothetical protein
MRHVIFPYIFQERKIKLFMKDLRN